MAMTSFSPARTWAEVVKTNVGYGGASHCQKNETKKILYGPKIETPTYVTGKIDLKKGVFSPTRYPFLEYPVLHPRKGEFHAFLVKYPKFKLGVVLEDDSIQSYYFVDNFHMYPVEPMLDADKKKTMMFS